MPSGGITTGPTASMYFIYTATGAEGASFSITLPRTRPNTSYVATVTGGGLNALLQFDCPRSSYLTTAFTCIAAAAPTAGDVLIVAVEQLT